MVPDELLKFKGQPGFEYLDQFGKGTKKCTRCGEVKDKGLFNRHKSTKDQLNTVCRECGKEANRAYNKKAKEINAGKPKDPDYFKTCLKCGITKNSYDFGRNSGMRDGLTHWCRACNKQENRRYRQDNPEATKRSTEYNKKIRKLSRIHATKSGRYSLEEDLVVLDPTITSYNKAVKLGRSISSVESRKQRFKEKGVLTVEDLKKSLA